MNSFSTLLRQAVFALGIVAALPAGAHSAAPVTSHDLSVNGVTLHYLQSGDGHGTPIILLHGYTQTSHMWLPLMAKLDGRTVIAVDLPGAGDSSIPASGYDKKTMAQDVHALAQSLGYRKVQLVGHDIGLMVAYAYAAQYPQEVQSLTLMDAFLPGVGDWQKVWLLRDKWHFNFYGDTPLKLVQGRERIYFEHFWNDFAADPNHSLSEADREYYTAQYARPGRMRAGFEYFHAFSQDAQDFAGFAKTPLTMPVQVLTGEKASGTFLIDQAKLIGTNVHGTIIKGSGHWLMSEAPGQTIPALVNFLNQHAT
ncbi:alpha/beta fold hydrolase [Dyella flava]|uniref:Alpha/beta hydrolase n=1 Tax=Dyella flava TaxID=1920170 RepID=A0ABS2K1G8_9GAMM|nr:alpha/beta hydrolase [Dyella flava]MBM7125106.1 alpha/beta hydrolase [Dyella flava]GLQ51979.1 epoxide hydrolase [Dyella flava]